MELTSPKCSIVVTGRNDNYGGNFIGRFQSFVDVLAPQILEYRPLFELVVVEWNPPVDKEKIASAVNWRGAEGKGIVRIIQVPNIIHNSLENSEKIQLFEFLGKNAGIRRSRGDFVLITNPDILFTEELIRLIAMETLEPKGFYRIDRYDFRSLRERVGNNQVNYITSAKENVFQVHIRPDNRKLSTLKISSEMVREYTRTGNWPGTVHGNDSNSTVQNPISELGDDGINGGVFSNASGDFVLTHRNNLDGVRGFPEFTDTITSLDSYLCFQLKAWGCTQYHFAPPCMILHEDHSREEFAKRPKSSDKKKMNDLIKILEGNLGPALNGENWGLARHELEEEYV